MAVKKQLPLLNSEAKQLRFLIGLYQEADNTQSVMKLRLASIGAAARLQNAADEIKSICGELILTIPAKKVSAFLGTTKNMQMELHQKRDIDMSDEYTNVPTEAFRKVCAEACVEKCGLCMGGDDEYDKCPLREALDSFLLIDVEKEWYECPYKRFDWSDSIGQST